ncbi:hypothetical protein LPB86_17125 [Pedobacter sp. MC2016-14]|uniref:hypothetical protein n=1 Tax=Pedobacter sp. MC2016-14 TaxID=2897327 RepID=UPI001E51D231|nr:hypothetical protein [Pedobacter sp. MC2016-14]MCD0489968.1 hypothetical protein [Pedobacter sp. MC2016-14]
MNYTDKKISDKRAIAILAKNGIQVDDEEAVIILEFLYLVSKNLSKNKEEKNVGILKEKSNFRKSS